MKYLLLALLFLSFGVRADYYDVQVTSAESFVVVVDGVEVKDASNRYFTYARAVNEASKRKDKCRSSCAIYVRMMDLKIDGKLIRESSSSSSSSAPISSSAASSVAATTKISMSNAIACEDGQPLDYNKVTRYEAIVVSYGVTRFITIPKSPDPIIADIGIVKDTDSVKAATVAIECGGTEELYSKWVVVQ